ncbi:MAG: hypothetical protein F6K56_32550 [Moorea sp. SIO3G5]|nr:hypothetical protein [Moorena sp. SIO3G5]
MFSQKLSAVSGQQSAVSGQRSAYFLQKHQLRYGHAARTVAPSVAHRLIADS